MEDTDNKYFKDLLALLPSAAIQKVFTTQGDNADTEDDSGIDTNISGGKRKAATVGHKEEKILGKKRSKPKRKKVKNRVNDRKALAANEIKPNALNTDHKCEQNAGGLLADQQSQEAKRLRRKQRKLSEKKSKRKRKRTGPAPPSTVQDGGEPTKAVSQAGSGQKAEVSSQSMDLKFNIGPIGTVKRKLTASTVRGKDYKRLLEKVEGREEKTRKVRETDAAAGDKLKEKHLWQDTMNKARKEKIIDNVQRIKALMKNKEKRKEQRTKKWQKRVDVTKILQQKRQDKRNKNIQKRKDERQSRKKKKLIKKGRLIPGL